MISIIILIVGSAHINIQVRKQDLSPLFINLLRDQSRWVRMAAFQALGPFISTFADPAITALLHNENGEIVITDTVQLVTRMIKIEEERAYAAAEEDSTEENSADTERKVSCVLISTYRTTFLHG